MLQTKDKWFLNQLQPKSQNRHFHTPAENSLLMQKQAWHMTTHFVVEGHKWTDRLTHRISIVASLQLAVTEVKRDFWQLLSRGRPKHHSGDPLKCRKEAVTAPISQVECVPPDRHWYCLHDSFRGRFLRNSRLKRVQHAFSRSRMFF